MVLFYSVFYVSIIGRSDYLSRNAYLAITAHFVSNSGKLTQLLLAIEPIPGPKTAICIKEMIDDIITKKWKLNSKMIYRFISDAASPNVCAFKNDYTGA